MQILNSLEVCKHLQALKILHVLESIEQQITTSKLYPSHKRINFDSYTYIVKMQTVIELQTETELQQTFLLGKLASIVMPLLLNRSEILVAMSGCPTRL